MEVINSKHHITKSVVKKNEEAFVRAIAIAKEQFSGSCGSWLRELDGMLSDVPNWSHSTVFGKKVSLLYHTILVTVFSLDG